MPFAEKYRFTMRLPDAGGSLGDFTVESCEVRHHERGDGTIDYPVTMVICGKGGVAGARKALREHLDRGRTTFSGFGNPYQLRLGRFEVQGLGGGRYRVNGTGVGVRIDLERELRRFIAYARLRRRPAEEELLESYLADYRRDITRRKPELEY